LDVCRTSEKDPGPKKNDPKLDQPFRLLHIFPLFLFYIHRHQASTLFGQGFQNSPEVADAPAGDRLRVRAEIENLNRNKTLIAILDQSSQNRDEFRLAKARSPSIGIVDMNMT
jgi:hypothetical protein